MSRSPLQKFFWILAALALATGSSGCVDAYKKSLGPDTSLNFSRFYSTDFNTAWQAVLESLKAVAIETSNREAGVLLTRWTENTSNKNFTDSFGAGADSYLTAKYRVRVTVAKGYFNRKPSIKVAVLKEQVVQRDVLEGWRPIETDSVEEKTLLYRIGRIIFMKTKIAKIEEEKIKKSMEEGMSPPVEGTQPTETQLPENSMPEPGAPEPVAPPAGGGELPPP